MGRPGLPATSRAGRTPSARSGRASIENFLDVGHFPFVHAGYLGDPEHAEIEDYEAEITPTGVIARDIPIWQPDSHDGGKTSKVMYTYEVLKPLAVRFTKAQGEKRFKHDRHRDAGRRAAASRGRSWP
jgi:phenylpropionate dioxygenase-like ring-hydroxylating dioxygenase large terminal subunit